MNKYQYHNKLAIYLLSILSFPLTASALQPQANGLTLPLEKGTKIERLTDDLELNMEEKTKVEAIINDEQIKYKAAVTDEQACMKTALTPEQMTKLSTIEQQRHLNQPAAGTK